MVTFNPETHEYFRDGEKLISVTQLMKKHGLAPDYSGVSEEVLKAKAERGTLIHKEIEEYCKTGEIGFTEECAKFAEYFEDNELEAIANEEIVDYACVAGTVDLIYESPAMGYTVLADIKTTSTLHRDAVSWQLSIYEYLCGWCHDDIQAIWFDKDGNIVFESIPLKPYEEVEALISCEMRGEIYTPKAVEVATPAQLEAIEKAEAIIAEAEAKKQEAEATMAEIKAAIIAAMEANAVKTYESDRLKITYIAPGERKTIDSTRLKKEKPDIAEQFAKITKTSASLRIIMKGE